MVAILRQQLLCPWLGDRDDDQGDDHDGVYNDDPGDDHGGVYDVGRDRAHDDYHGYGDKEDDDL